MHSHEEGIGIDCIAVLYSLVRLFQLF